MKHGTPNHIKMRRLARILKIERAHAVGLVQCLWHATIDNALAGDIGRISDIEIADFCDWHKEPSELIAAFLEAGWLDRCADHRLVVHDWSDHAENWVKKRAKERGITLLGRGVERADNGCSTNVEQGLTVTHPPRMSDTLTPPTHSSPPHPLPIPPHSSPPMPSSGECASSMRPIRFSSALQASPIYALYPKCGQTEKPKALRAILNALNDLDARGLPEPDVWLAARVVAFAASPVGRGSYAPFATKWFETARFDDAPEAWEKCDEPKANGKPDRGGDTPDRRAKREREYPEDVALPVVRVGQNGGVGASKAAP